MKDENNTENTPITPAAVETAVPVEPAQTAKQKVISPVRAAVAAVIVLAAVAAPVVILKKNAKQVAHTPAPVASSNGAEDQTSASTRISVVEKGKLILTGGYADPTVVPTKTGYRMYVNRQSGGPSGYLTFTSKDGVAWEKENGIVIPGVATGRAVVLPDGVRVYYPGPQPIKPSDPPADMFSSFSKDGVSFTKDAGTRLEPRSSAHYVEGPTVFQLPDKTWRMYFNENTIEAGNQRDGIIWGASSEDGLAWTRDKQPTIESDDVEAALNQPWKQVLHPFVIKNPRGGYIMFYNSHSEIFAATSQDGKSWTKIGQIGIHGADVDGFFQADGTLRVYYGDFTEETGGVVYSAVLGIQ